MDFGNFEALKYERLNILNLIAILHIHFTFVSQIMLLKGFPEYASSEKNGGIKKPLICNGYVFLFPHFSHFSQCAEMIPTCILSVMCAWINRKQRHCMNRFVQVKANISQLKHQTSQYRQIQL